MSEDFPALSGFRAGSLLAGYRLEAQIGAGGMAVVFRARDERLGRLVALKILAPTMAADAAFRRRFIAESQAAAAVDDPHIIPVHEAGEAGGVLYIAMRFVMGGDLRRVLEREGALPPGRAAEFLSPVASALDAAHRAGLVHRDVKPANILVDAGPGRPDHVYLSDFGVSKGAAGSVSLTGTGQFLGTPDYSAPEQIQGQAVDGRADQYALACVAFQLLTGAAPFAREQGMAVLLAHLTEMPPSVGSRRPDLPEAADRVLARGMAKVPEKRYGSCRDFADALREALGLAPYYSHGPASTAGHPPAPVISPPPGFPGPATASPAAGAVPPVTETAPSPAKSAAGQTDAEPHAGPAAPPGDGDQGAMPLSREDRTRVAVAGPGPGPGRRTPRAPRPHRVGRASRRRPAIIAAAVGIAVIGLVIAATIIFIGPGTPGTSVRWAYTTGGPVTNTVPAVAGGTVYIGGDKVYALDTATGHLRWTYTTGGIVGPGPAVAGSTVYIGGDSKVYALDTATGHPRWTYTTGGVVGFYGSGPAVAGGTVYVGSLDHKVYALDTATGHLRWTYTTAGIVDCEPAVADGTVYVSSQPHGKVYALDAATGHLRWTYTTGSLIDSSPAVTGGTVYIAGDKVYALDAATGHLRWAYTAVGGVGSGPAVAGGTVYIGSEDHKVYALDTATGHLRWTYTTGDVVSSIPAVAGGTVYVGSSDHKVYALDTATGHLRWAYTTAGPVASSPAVADGTVYIASAGADHNVYALNTGS